MTDEVALRGFDMPLSDIGDQLHFRLPLLSFRSSATLYLAGRVDWNVDRQALLTVVDDPEDRELATLLPDGVGRYLVPGQGVVVAGAEFFHAASRIGDQLGDFSHLSAADCECWIGMATPAEFIALKDELIDGSRAVFDRELAKAGRRGSRLTERGDAAMLILSSCGPLRREDLAIRQLAAARQNRDFDLYRRLLTRFEHELGEPEGRLHKQVGRHIELVDELEGTWLPPNMLKSGTVPMHDELAEQLHKAAHVIMSSNVPSFLLENALFTPASRSTGSSKTSKQWHGIAASSKGVWTFQPPSVILISSWLSEALAAGHRHLAPERKLMSDIPWSRWEMNMFSADMSGTKDRWEEMCDLAQSG